MIELLTRLERAGALDMLDVELARSLARLAKQADPQVGLALALVSRALREGHVCLELRALAGAPVRNERGEETGVSGPELESWLQSLQRSPLVGAARGAGKPQVLDPPRRLYFARYFDHEARTAAHVARLARAELAPPPIEGNALERLFPTRSDGTPALQREAALAARSRQLSLIVGGPGTGKTSTVVRLLALLVDDATRGGAPAPRILMVAPTGKAAQRLSEAVGRARERLPVDEPVRDAIPREAFTIHRALGSSDASSPRLRHHAGNPLGCDIMLLDEASMVDLALMRRLLDAVPAHARVIMLGDPDQLAAVEAGGVLADLCQACESEPRLARSLSRLSESYRYAPDSGIAQLARAIHAQDAEWALALLAADLPDASLHPAPAARGTRGALWEHARERYAGLRAAELQQRLAALEDYRVLCAHRSGPAGVEQLNQGLARVVHGAQRGEHYAGRPLLITQNDYASRLFNGDVGVLHAERRGALVACFRSDDTGEPRAISPARLPGHESVYAMTVHKSQGSEFRELAIVLPDAASPLLSRELLFTAITRARESVRLYGGPAAIRAALARRLKRSSGLPARLAELVRGQPSAPQALSTGAAADTSRRRTPEEE
jgi:exodeoxyribonuclease V alpha subunit